MNTREDEILARYLDGEMSLDALPEPLRREAQAFERAMGAVKGRPVRLPPAARANVMNEVRALARSPWRRGWEWLVAPQPIRLSRLTAGMAAAATLAFVLLLRPGQRVTTDVPMAGVTVRFVYVAPQASRVAVTGDFASWDPEGIPLNRTTSGVWVAEISLRPGMHHYLFIVDGSRWEPDPNAPSRVTDGFGNENSVLVVPEPKRSS